MDDAALAITVALITAAATLAGVVLAGVLQERGEERRMARAEAKESRAVWLAKKEDLFGEFLSYVEPWRRRGSTLKHGTVEPHEIENPLSPDDFVVEMPRLLARMSLIAEPATVEAAWALQIAVGFAANMPPAVTDETPEQDRNVIFDWADAAYKTCVKAMRSELGAPSP